MTAQLGWLGESIISALILLLASETKYSQSGRASISAASVVEGRDHNLLSVWIRGEPQERSTWQRRDGMEDKKRLGYHRDETSGDSGWKLAAQTGDKVCSPFACRVRPPARLSVCPSFPFF